MSGFCLYSEGIQWVKVSREALGAAYSECVTMARLLVPMNLQKVDQGVSTFLDYLYINLADLIGIRCVNFADSLGIKCGEQKGNQLLSVLSIEDGIMIWEVYGHIQIQSLMFC